MAPVAIVCGYGSRDDAVLRDYLEAVARQCQERGIERLIVSGGGGEAQLMAAVLRPILDVPIDLEPEALTTLENLQRSAALLGDARDVVVFVDRVRYAKARVLAPLVLRGVALDVVAIPRPESIATWLWQLISIPLQLAAALIPPLASLLHRLKANARTSSSR